MNDRKQVIYDKISIQTWIFAALSIPIAVVDVYFFRLTLSEKMDWPLNDPLTLMFSCGFALGALVIAAFVGERLHNHNTIRGKRIVVSILIIAWIVIGVVFLSLRITTETDGDKYGYVAIAVLFFGFYVFDGFLSYAAASELLDKVLWTHIRANKKMKKNISKCIELKSELLKIETDTDTDSNVAEREQNYRIKTNDFLKSRGEYVQNYKKAKEAYERLSQGADFPLDINQEILDYKPKENSYWGYLKNRAEVERLSIECEKIRGELIGSEIKDSAEKDIKLFQDSVKQITKIYFKEFVPRRMSTAVRKLRDIDAFTGSPEKIYKYIGYDENGNPQGEIPKLEIRFEGIQE